MGNDGSVMVIFFVGRNIMYDIFYCILFFLYVEFIVCDKKNE